ncbi:unnamed protein product [Parascedosporium putredinis]|uniref:Uncharacterized protein n=1 Tax=Parascedosporium putredinis TaxID=1442378 RepID=A0A9P1M7A6_9PEZI|nr:unnamed protein product [Parascedosporium putredinis]CAI7987493.1 unnamed protein product [Parascedosporium putredinis]
MVSSSAVRPWGLEHVALLSLFSAVALAQGNGNNNGNDGDDDPTPTQPANSPSDYAYCGRYHYPWRGTDLLQRRWRHPLPTLPGSFTRPTPAVPPTIDAPFMDRSTMPDGTVFIAVGAILGAFGLAVLIWRAIVACLLHRSVERAAAAQHLANEKSTYLAPPAAFYKNTERDPRPRRWTRQSNLFFSPTAVNTAGMGGNRDSRYLPSGFYASGSPAMNAPAPGSYSNLRPDSRGGGFSRNTMRDHSPEGSPQFAVRQQDPSMSSLNLNRPPSQRAPSAYLDDLLDENPQMFPPAQMPPQAARGRGGY